MGLMPSHQCSRPADSTANLTFPSLEGGSDRLRCAGGLRFRLVRALVRGRICVHHAELLRRPVFRGPVQRSDVAGLPAYDLPPLPKYLIGFSLAIVSPPDAPPRRCASLVSELQAVRNSGHPDRRSHSVHLGGCARLRRDLRLRRLGQGRSCRSDRGHLAHAQSAVSVSMPIGRCPTSRASRSCWWSLAWLVGVAANLVGANRPGFVAPVPRSPGSPPVWRSSASSTASSAR